DEHRQGRAQSGEREKVLRLGADARRAENRRRVAQLPGAFEPVGARAARCAEDGRNQAHQLQLRQIRQRHRAQAAAREMGPRGLRDTALARLVYHWVTLFLPLAWVGFLAPLT